MPIDPNAILRGFEGRHPVVDSSAFVGPGVVLIGDVRIGPGVSVWPGAVLRGDECVIRVGRGSNIQDGVVIHGDPGHDVTIGEEVTIGHRAVVHGCTIADGALVGMGATVLDLVQVGRRALIGASALVTAGMAIPEATLWAGVPARQIRQLDEAAAEALTHNAHGYLDLVRRYAEFR